VTPVPPPDLLRLAPRADPIAAREGPDARMTIELQRVDGRWRVEVQGAAPPRPIEGLHELIRWLVDLAAPAPRPPRDLR
jgi:hypothetical protein